MCLSDLPCKYCGYTICNRYCPLAQAAYELRDAKIREESLKLFTPEGRAHIYQERFLDRTEDGSL